MSRSDSSGRRSATPRGVTYVVSLHWPSFPDEDLPIVSATEAAAPAPSASSNVSAPHDSDAGTNASSDSEDLEFTRRDARELRRRQGNINQAMRDLRAEHNLRAQHYRPVFLRAFQLLGTLQDDVRDLRSRLDTSPTTNH